MPHPQDLLIDPPTKLAFRNLVRKKVISYWEKLLRAEAAPKPSLLFFRPSFMSLASTHPIFTTAGSSPAKVAMASVQSVMASGRYRTEALCSHWSKNKKGVCLLSDQCSDTVDDIPHIITSCPALENTRNRLTQFTKNYIEKLSVDTAAVLQTLCSPTNLSTSNFLLDASTLPEVISVVQRHRHHLLELIYNITRTWT